MRRTITHVSNALRNAFPTTSPSTTNPERHASAVPSAAHSGIICALKALPRNVWKKGFMLSFSLPTPVISPSAFPTWCRYCGTCPGGQSEYVCQKLTSDVISTLEIPHLDKQMKFYKAYMLRSAFKARTRCLVVSEIGVSGNRGGQVRPCELVAQQPQHDRWLQQNATRRYGMLPSANV